LFATYNSVHFLLHTMLCYHSTTHSIFILLLQQSLNLEWHTMGVQVHIWHNDDDDDDDNSTGNKK
jgi:hypothetical protein